MRVPGGSWFHCPLLCLTDPESDTGLKGGGVLSLHDVGLSLPAPPLSSPFRHLTPGPGRSRPPGLVRVAPAGRMGGGVRLSMAVP